MQKFRRFNYLALATLFTFTAVTGGSMIIIPPVKEAHAATITAVSCNQADVQAAINSAGDGDTVMIPEGNCHWTTQVSWTAPANVTLKGAGSSVIGGGDQTVIIDDYASNNNLLTITANATGTFRMTGLTFQGGSGTLKDSGMLVIRGPATVRLDHLHINSQTYSPPLNIIVLLFSERVFGVIDHSIFDMQGVSAIYFFNGGGTDGQGNVTWAAPTDFGQSNFMFLEDNQINGTLNGGPIRLGDAYSASRVVARFNTLRGSSGLEVHATGHSPDDRGARAIETYGNRFDQLPGASSIDSARVMADLGSGTALVWGNVASDNAIKTPMIFNITRKNNDTYNQQMTPTGWGYCGTSFNGTGSNWDQNSSASLGYACLDQPGRGQGQLLTGIFPNKLNNTTGTIAWPNQALEPIYFWNNTVVPAPAYSGSFYSDNSGGRVLADRDYYAQASGEQMTSSSPFDGTTGTGWGTLANRPDTCTAGVGYFATDQGSWNTSTSNLYGVQQNGADGVLHKCGASNTWTTYYTPYTYPHPLTLGGSSSTPPTLTLGSSPSSITQGQSSTLTWSSTNATSCTASQGWSGTKPTSGSESFSPTVTTTYALLCSGDGGSTSQSTTVTVTTAPTFDFSLTNNGNLTLTQGTSGVRTITASLLSGTSEAASFITTGLPSNTTASFSPTACAPTCTSTLSLQTSLSTPAGSYPLTITGTDSYLTKTTALTLTVSPVLTQKFQLNDRVMVTTRKLNVRKTPAGKNIGFHKQNDQGTVIAGPTVANGLTWYNIDYDSSPDGWSAEDYLEKVVVATSDEPVDTLIVDLFRSTTNISLLATPLTAESKTLLLFEITRLIGVIGKLLAEIGG